MSRAEHLREIFAECGISAALAVVGERWSFLILRGAFNGLRHFEEFQTNLGIARNILSNRLGRLVEHGILRRDPDPADRRKVTYRLTEKGKDLLPVLLSLRQWGERWISGHPSNPVLVDRYTRQPIAPMTVQSADGRPLSLRDMEWVDRAELDRETDAA
ncbi:MAG TPA: helix-turn-helix domain-containing protein [Allosphingosinicella sp.]|jgi:DNA-binding HxlR family transcriptional regulator